MVADIEYGIQRGEAILGVYETVEDARQALYRTSAPSGSYPRLVQRDVPGGLWSAVLSTSDNGSISVLTVEEQAAQLVKHMVTGTNS